MSLNTVQVFETKLRLFIHFPQKKFKTKITETRIIHQRRETNAYVVGTVASRDSWRVYDIYILLVLQVVLCYI